MKRFTKKRRKDENGGVGMRKNKQSAAAPIPAHKKLGKQIMKHGNFTFCCCPVSC